LGAREAAAEAAPQPLPRLCRADAERHDPRRHEALQEEAPGLCRGGAVPHREATGLDRSGALRVAAIRGEDRPGDQPAHDLRGGAAPNVDPEAAYNRHPTRRWCETGVCIASHYAFEGKLPLGIRLANKLEEGGKKIAEAMDFQSEIRTLPPQELAAANLARLTGLDTAVAGALEQNTFWVNQILTFGKFLAVFQAHPSDPGKTVVTAFMALGIKSDVLEKKKEFEQVPVLRNLVPAQVLAGNSSFNTGSSISAGLPKYARKRIERVSELMRTE